MNILFSLLTQTQIKSGEEPMNSYGYGMNVSDLVCANVYTELPAVTNVHGVDVSYEAGECFVTIEWDEPADKDKYMFVQYNVFVKGIADSGHFENLLQPTATKMSIGWGDENTELSSDIYVQAVYAIGKLTVIQLLSLTI